MSSTVADDRAAIIEVTTRMLRNADLRDWDRLRACFTEQVAVDYSSMGGSTEDLSADELVSQFEQELSTLDATHHLIASHLVDIEDDGDAATCRANFQAQHVLSNDEGADETWMLAGRYEFGLTRTGDTWKISALTTIPVWDEGDEQILEKAAEQQEKEQG